jgi:hypothetical protein
VVDKAGLQDAMQVYTGLSPKKHLNSRYSRKYGNFITKKISDLDQIDNWKILKPIRLQGRPKKEIFIISNFNVGGRSDKKSSEQ